ncbi:hypothetical protein BCO_0900040 (plasmid) [Borrelia coriaceae ATCC 43381]|uniref:Uncharacterized protein n=1 Tax=Borrelia coriaceae ATCC 43381 TaxID=1408429 RepID=W5SWB5_9SPIR|nr:hypothetical protein BCO_0900040 [Borrelia coriaceae ATCC 43381]
MMIFKAYLLLKMHYVIGKNIESETTVYYAYNRLHAT